MAIPIPQRKPAPLGGLANMSLPGFSPTISPSSGAVGGTIGPVENVLSFGGADDPKALIALVGVIALGAYIFWAK